MIAESGGQKLSKNRSNSVASWGAILRFGE